MPKKPKSKRDPVAGAISALRADSEYRLKQGKIEIDAILAKYTLAIVNGYEEEGKCVFPGVIVHASFPTLKDVARPETDPAP